MPPDEAGVVDGGAFDTGALIVTEDAGVDVEVAVRATVKVKLPEMTSPSSA
jgi:hypothetical protein